MPVQPFFDSKDNAEGQLLSSISAVVLSIPLNAAEGANFPQPIKGLADSAGSETVLNSTGIGATGVAVGDYIENVTDSSHAWVLSVNTDDLVTTPLRGGTDDTWQDTDVFGVNRFVLTLNSRDMAGLITDFEEVLIEDRSTDTLIIAAGGRGYNGTTPDTWNSDDYASIFVTDPIIKGIRDLLFRLDKNKLSTDGLSPLLNNTSLTGRNNADSANVEMMKVGTNDIPVFPTLPRLDAGRTISDDQDLVDKEYYEANFPSVSISSKTEAAAAVRELFQNIDKGNNLSWKNSAGEVYELNDSYQLGETFSGGEPACLFGAKPHVGDLSTNADTYVDSANAASNFSAATTLKASSTTPDQDVLLQFDFSGITDIKRLVSFDLVVNQLSSESPTDNLPVVVVDEAVVISTVTWNTRPTTFLATIGTGVTLASPGLVTINCTVPDQANSDAIIANGLQFTEDGNSPALAFESLEGAGTDEPKLTNIVYISNDGKIRKTSALYIESVNSYLGFVQESGILDDFRIATRDGVIDKTATLGDTYYLANAAGTISVSPGTNSLIAGHGVGTNRIRVNPQVWGVI